MVDNGAQLVVSGPLCYKPLGVTGLGVKIGVTPPSAIWPRHSACPKAVCSQKGFRRTAHDEMAMLPSALELGLSREGK